MKVYLVMWRYYDDTTVEGVFFSPISAQEYIDTKPNWVGDLDIEEFEVQGYKEEI